MKLRTEKAALLGFASSAEYLLDDKMAEDVAAGLLPEGSKIEPWDWFYYAEKVRKVKYDLDEEQTKPYFQVDSVRKGVFYAAEKVYGVKGTPAPEVEVYNPAVTAWKVSDADGSLLGIFYCDYFSRDIKRGGAWMNNFREQMVDASGNDIRPIIVNCCNFPPATEEAPSLLTVDEVQTAFHEFGHALHGFLTKCHYQSVSGTAVARDFVETFSQFNENWAFEKDILSQYAHHYQTGETIPAELVEKINNSLKFNQGFTTGELCAASILDMRWHELDAAALEPFEADGSVEGRSAAVRDFEDKVCDDMGLIEEIIPRYRTSYFNHIFNSGYSAGYYSYLWSEVLERDAF